MGIPLDRRPGDPTPLQIAQRAAKIRLSWKWPETYFDRAGINPFHLAVSFDRPATIGVASGRGEIKV